MTQVQTKTPLTAVTASPASVITSSGVSPLQQQALATPTWNPHVLTAIGALILLTSGSLSRQFVSSDLWTDLLIVIAVFSASLFFFLSFSLYLGYQVRPSVNQDFSTLVANTLQPHAQNQLEAGIQHVDGWFHEMFGDYIDLNLIVVRIRLALLVLLMLVGLGSIAINLFLIMIFAVVFYSHRALIRIFKHSAYCRGKRNTSLGFAAWYAGACAGIGFGGVYLVVTLLDGFMHALGLR